MTFVMLLLLLIFLVIGINNPVVHAIPITTSNANNAQTPLMIDCFVFNGEPLAFFRMNYLKDFIDLFVVVEMKESFSGIEKPHYLFPHHKEHYNDIPSSKILYLQAGLFPNASMYKENARHFTHRYDTTVLDQNEKRGVFDKRMLPFSRERYARDYATSQIISRLPNRDFILLISDFDEIPRLSTLQSLPAMYHKLSAMTRLDMSTFYYDLNWLKVNGRINRAFVINNHGISNATSVHEMRFSNVKRVAVLPKAGWHFSYFMTSEAIKRKIESFAHQELNTPEFANLTWIDMCRNQGLDLFKRPWVEEIIVSYDYSEGHPVCTTCSAFGHLLPATLRAKMTAPSP